MESVLAKEKAETKKRVAALKEQTKLEHLRKDELELEHDCYKHTNIFQWIKQAFRLGKGGKNNK